MFYLAQAHLSLKRPKKSQNWVGGAKTIRWCFAEPKFPSVVQGSRTKPAAGQGGVDTAQPQEWEEPGTLQGHQALLSLSLNVQGMIPVSKNSLKVKCSMVYWRLINKALL